MIYSILAQGNRFNRTTKAFQSNIFFSQIFPEIFYILKQFILHLEFNNGQKW